MRCIPWILLSLLFRISLAVAQPAEPLPAEGGLDLRTKVARLVRQLDDDELTRRQQAEQELMELGPAVLEVLPPISPRTPAEAKVRLERVRKTLESRMAEAAANSSTVTLKGTLPLEEAFAQLESQTGNRVVGYQNRGGQVTVDWNQVPYWAALDQLLDQAELRINAYGGESTALVVEAKPPGELPRSGSATYAGIFRFEPLRLEARRDLRNPTVSGLGLTMEISWEPRIRPISLQQALDQIQARDEAGRSLAVDTQPGRLTASADSGITAVELRLPLSLPPRDAQQIASLKGTLQAVVPGSRATFEFSELASARDVEQQNAGVTVVFERMRRNLDLYEIRVLVRFEEAGETLQSHRGWVFSNEAFVTDPEGHRIENVGLQTTRQEAAQVGVAYLFPLPAGPEGCTFVYKTPASILRLPVDYELRDIELP